MGFQGHSADTEPIHNPMTIYTVVEAGVGWPCWTIVLTNMQTLRAGEYSENIFASVEINFTRSYKIILNINTLQWRRNKCDGVSNHQPQDCLFNCLSRHRSKKISKLRVTGLCGGIHRWPVHSPHERKVTRKMLPFDDDTTTYSIYCVDIFSICMCRGFQTRLCDSIF